VEVPGTRDKVWQAVATGAGISAWFVPAEVEECEGGRVVCRFGPGMDSVAVATEWEPPERFVAESDDLGPGAPPLVTEWTVEETGEGGCLVRVEHSVQTESTKWDAHLESIERGWPGFFGILELYLSYFQGLSCENFRVMELIPGTPAEVWSRMVEQLGLRGRLWRSEMGSGMVEVRSLGGHHECAILRMESPAPGLLSMSAFSMDGKVCVLVSGYLYGDGAAEGRRTLEPLWQTWMKRKFADG
jgi:uncharacterized protein YndB with AHSA1/START domain